MSNSIFCIVADYPQAHRIVAELKESGFANDEISVLLSEGSARVDSKQGESPEIANDLDTKAPQGVAAGAVAGSVLGGTVGWLVGIGSLAIPGLGPFIAAGPIMAILSGIAVGGTMGGVTGMLVGMGIPENEAHRYESKLRGGNVLVSVHSDDPQAVQLAEDIFRRSGAEHISRSSQSTVPDRDQ